MSAPTINQAVAAASVQELGDSLRGALIAPGDPTYDDARRPWNAMVDKRPALIAQGADAGDVASAIAFARRHGLEIGVKGGGHSVVGHAVPDGGLMIDLSPMAPSASIPSSGSRMSVEERCSETSTVRPSRTASPRPPETSRTPVSAG